MMTCMLDKCMVGTITLPHMEIEIPNGSISGGISVSISVRVTH